MTLNGDSPLQHLLYFIIILYRRCSFCHATSMAKDPFGYISFYQASTKCISTSTSFGWYHVHVSHTHFHFISLKKLHQIIASLSLRFHRERLLFHMYGETFASSATCDIVSNFSFLFHVEFSVCQPKIHDIKLIEY